MSKQFIFTLLFIFATISNATATRYYVKPDVANNIGNNWDTATNLQDALDKAQNTGDEIWVAQGTYTPTTDGDRTKSFILKSGVSIYGSFVGTEESVADRIGTREGTILSGEIGDPSIKTDNSFHVITMEANNGETTLLDGFTIKDGYSDQTASPYGTSNAIGGAGIFTKAIVAHSKVVINNNIITNNNIENTDSYAAHGAGICVEGFADITNNEILSNTINSSDFCLGGGIYINNTTAAVEAFTTIKNNRIKDNSIYSSAKDVSGGGIFGIGFLSISKNEIAGNTISSFLTIGGTYNGGGGITIFNMNNRSYYAELTENTISDNILTSSLAPGGGVLFVGMGNIANNNINNNIASCTNNMASIAAGGGGIFLLGKITVTNNKIESNKIETTGSDIYSAFIFGGGISLRGESDFTPTLTNNLIVDNVIKHEATGRDMNILGGGVFSTNEAADKIILTNNTITNNRMEGSGDADYKLGSGALIISNVEGNTAIYNSIIYGNTGAANFENFAELNSFDPKVEYSLVEGGFAGIGNIDSDPMFADPLNKSYRLKAGSPAIGKANVSVAEYKPTDIEGYNRHATNPNMGAYERIANSVRPPVTPPKSSNATLRSLTVSEGELSPQFNPNVENYTVELKDTNSITVEATTDSYLATVEGTGTYNLQQGSNKIEVIVTAEDGTTKTYSIVVYYFPTGVGIDPVASSQIKVYPTLTTGKVYVESETSNPTIELYSITGKMLQKIQSSELDLSTYPKGLYILRTEGKTIKVVKQ